MAPDAVLTHANRFKRYWKNMEKTKTTTTL